MYVSIISVLKVQSLGLCVTWTLVNAGVCCTRVASSVTSARTATIILVVTSLTAVCSAAVMIQVVSTISQMCLKCCCLCSHEHHTYILYMSTLYLHVHNYARYIVHVCRCTLQGTANDSLICDKQTGECDCKANVEGSTCNQCMPNTYNLTSDNPLGCDACNCDVTGTVSGNQLPVGELACEHNTGQCTCLANRLGAKCDQCVQGQCKNK